VNNVRVTSGNGSVAGVMVSGNMATISLTGVADAQALTLGFDVASASSLASFQLPIRFLFGDANGDGVVNSGDAIQTRKRAGQATTLTNFQYDLNADGVINGGDAIVVRSRAGNFVP
jgi:hypothetical protein